MTSKRRVVIGIDPGAKGSFCALLVDSGKAIFMDTTGKPQDILAWLNTIKESYDLKVIMVENVSVIPGAAAGSSFNFGHNVGVVRTLAMCTGCMVDEVRPKKWQKHVGLTIKAGVSGVERQKAIKHGVAAICERLYPNVNIRGPKGGLLDGKSDALMIAHYANLIYP